jgi:signal transduction histidine kinase
MSIKSLKTYVLVVLLAGEPVLSMSQDRKRLDSLEQELRTAHGATRFEIQFSLFREYIPVDQEKALFYVQSALDQATANADSLGIVKASFGKGFLIKNRGDLREAIKIFESALAIAKRNGFSDQVKYLLNNLAIAHTSNASYDKALDYNFESLKIREAEGDPQSIAIALNNIGLVYHELKDYENALAYYEKSYKVKVDNKVTYDVERILINIGLIYNALGQYDKATEKLNVAFENCKREECKPDLLMDLHQGLGIALINQGKEGPAVANFTKSLEISKKLGIAGYISSNLHWLAVAHFNEGKTDEAIEFLDKSIAVSKETNYRKMTLDNYLLYSKVYYSLNAYRKASQYQDLYIKLNEEIFNGDLIKNISRIQTDYEQQANIKTIAEKDQILALNQARIEQQRIFNIVLSAAILLASGLGIVIFRNYQKIKTVNAALAQAKLVIEEQNLLLDQQVQDKTKELVDTNEQLTKVNEELDNFIYKTSHDIRGPLASLKGMVNLAIMDVKDDKALGYLDKLDLTAEKLNMVLTRLLIVNRINHAELKPEVVHFEPIIQEILTLEVKKGVPAKVRIEFDVAPEANLVSDKEMIRLILENLIDNAIKFYNESERVESFVTIKVEVENGQVLARIMDNGVGIAQMDREKIFQMFVRASERSETGGIGLYLAKLATEKLGGDINLISTDEKYTEFIVRFPPDLSAIIERRRLEKKDRVAVA